MINFLYKIKLLLLRILCYEKPLRVAFIKYLSLKFPTFRPHYESLIFETSKNAIKLGFNEIDIIELIIISKLETSKSEIRRLIKGNAIKIDNELINGEKFSLNKKMSDRGFIKLSIGKKRHLKVEFN